MTEENAGSEEVKERISYIVVQEYTAAWDQEGFGQVNVAQEEILRLTYHEATAVIDWIRSGNKKLRLVPIVPPERIDVAKITAEYDAKIQKQAERLARSAEQYKKLADAKTIARKQKQFAKLKKELGVE